MLSILSDWVQPELNYDLTDRPLIDDMDEVHVHQADEQTLWLWADDELYAISRPGRHYELHVSLRHDLGVSIESSGDLTSLIRARHQYDHNLDGINFIPPSSNGPGRRSDVEASMVRTRYAAVRRLYRAVDLYADFPRYEQVKSYDDQVIMDRAEYEQNSDPILVNTLVGHQPGRGFALTREDRTYLFRPDKMTALGAVKQSRGATDREGVEQ